MWSKVVAYLLLQLLMVQSSTDILPARTCERIRVEECKNIGYNFTGFPNFAADDSQMEADMVLEGFLPLVQYGCSSRLQFLLCSVYFPMCTEKVVQLIGPCRPICEEVQALCEPVLTEFGFPWPSSLNCSKFPPKNEMDHMCMDGPEYEERKTYPFHGRSGVHLGIQRGLGVHFSKSGQHFRIPNVEADLRCQHLHLAGLYYYVNHTGRCAATCDGDILFSKENKDFAQMWMAVCSSCCFLSSFLLLIAFFMNTDHYRYPYRVIVAFSACSFMACIGYFVRLLGGRNNTACYWDTQNREPLLVQSGFDNINCTIVFILIYFFQMASNLWWVILSLIWFLTAGLKWSIEAVESYRTYFHLVAWLLPAVKTIAILMLRAVDADELTGTCYVGNQDPDLLLQFVLVPSITYLILGVIFLFAGTITVFKNEKLISGNTSSKEKWTLFKGHHGVFAFIYIVPAACILVANAYEYSFKDEWLAFGSELKPSLQVFTMKIFMSNVVGFATGVGLWISQASFTSERIFASAFCGGSKDLATGANENCAMLLEGPNGHKMTVV